MAVGPTGYDNAREIMKKEPVEILLATCNGASFVSGQVDSILNQRGVQVRLIMRDDLSTDGTREILESYATRFPQAVTLLPSAKRLGVKGNFSCLMENSTAAYVMLADQDDVWEADKVRLALAEMEELEKKYSPETPLIVHTDLKVVDRNLEIISHSFWKYHGIDPQAQQSLNRLLMQNVVTGCTLMMNRPLLTLALPVPEECAMHDWWLALVASAFGKIHALPKATMLYRQHGTNTLGATKFLSLGYVKAGLEKMRRPETAKQDQAKELFERYFSQLDGDQKLLLQAFRKLPQASFVEKMFLIFTYRFFKSGLLRNVANLFFKKQ